MTQQARITGDQVWGFVLTHLKLAPGFAFIFTFVGVCIWELWAEDKVEIKFKPIAKQVVTNSNDIKQVRFETAQILAILEKTVDKSIVNQVKRETERFRPERSK